MLIYYCSKCKDFFSLIGKERHCECGIVRGSSSEPPEHGTKIKIENKQFNRVLKDFPIPQKSIDIYAKIVP